MCSMIFMIYQLLAISHGTIDRDGQCPQVQLSPRRWDSVESLSFKWRRRVWWHQKSPLYQKCIWWIRHYWFSCRPWWQSCDCKSSHTKNRSDCRKLLGIIALLFGGGQILVLLQIQSWSDLISFLQQLVFKFKWSAIPSGKLVCLSFHHIIIIFGHKNRATLKNAGHSFPLWNAAFVNVSVVVHLKLWWLVVTRLIGQRVFATLSTCHSSSEDSDILLQCIHPCLEHCDCLTKISFL